MFKSARIKLTIWYLLIIMTVSGFFSLVVYRGFTKELGRGFRNTLNTPPQRHYIIQQQNGFTRILPFWIYPEEQAPDQYLEIVEMAKHRFAMQLTIINCLILVLSGTAGYFLAGKTLEPIEEMVHEQKRFVADASHELRTPLTSIKTETEVALRDKKLKLSEAKELLKSNLQEADRMKGLTDYLLTLSRFDAHLVDMKKEKINIAELIDDAIAKNLPQAKAKGITIEKQLKGIPVNGNRPSLTELFSVIINNAIKYSPDKTKVNIINFSSKKRVVVEITDQGIGIDKKDIPHIFDRFYRSDTSRSRIEAEGYGLGLAIAKSIADAHGGEINVASEPGKGTTFKVSLPR